MAEKKMVLVVGLGRFGSALCERLMNLKQYVVAVDKVRARVEALADVADLTAQLDATDEEALVKIGAREADVAVVAIGENTEASILASAILRELGVPYVMARAQTALHARVLARVGAHRVIFPERDMGMRVADHFVFPWLSHFSQIPGSELLVGKTTPRREMVGRSLADLNFRNAYNAVVLLVDRRGEQFIPRADTVIEATDQLFISGRSDEINEWIDSFKENKEEKR